MGMGTCTPGKAGFAGAPDRASSAGVNPACGKVPSVPGRLDAAEAAKHGAGEKGD